jgi:hypothetical protein
MPALDHRLTPAVLTSVANASDDSQTPNNEPRSTIHDQRSTINDQEDPAFGVPSTDTR